MTDNQLMKAKHITAKMAAEYLHIGEQSCRVLARSGKIGEAVPGTNRVIYQPHKLIRFKRGTPDIEAQARRVAELMEQTGKAAMALHKAVEEMTQFLTKMEGAKPT